MFDIYVPNFSSGLNQRLAEHDPQTTISSTVKDLCSGASIGRHLHFPILVLEF